MKAGKGVAIVGRGYNNIDHQDKKFQFPYLLSIITKCFNYEPRLNSKDHSLKIRYGTNIMYLGND